MDVLVPALTAVISIIFALMVFDQFLSRRKMHQLVWSLGLLFYAISSFAAFLGALDGWSPNEYRWYYYFGAFTVASYLGMGVVYLLAPRRYAHALFALLVLGSLFALYKVVVAPMDLSKLVVPAGEPPTKVFPADVRILAPLFNVPGAVALIGGALYSAWTFWRERTRSYRLVCNILIALGAFFPSVTGTLRFFGITPPLMLGEFLGVSIIFIGFLVSIEVFEEFRVPFTSITLGSRRAAP